MKLFKAIIATLLILCGATFASYAQKTLPDLSANAEKGYIVISWVNPYKSGVKAIIVERSVDSNTNFTTIGMVKELNASIQSFVDVTPLAGENWYRVSVVFDSDIDWKSNVTVVSLDSMAIVNRKQVASVDTLQKAVNEAINQKGSVQTNIVTKNVQQIEIPKSKYIFTNPFSGNINIELPNTREYNYFITFYDANNKKVFEIPRIHEDEIILDKRNFQNIGTYKFTILRDEKEFEKGFVTVY